MKAAFLVAQPVPKCYRISTSSTSFRRPYRATEKSLAIPPRPPQQRPPSSVPFYKGPDSQGPDVGLTPLVGRDALIQALQSAGRANASLVVVFCRAKWCRSCSTLAPKVARVAAQARRTLPSALAVHWYSMDIVDERNRLFTSEVNVKMLPTFLFYRPFSRSIDEKSTADAREDVESAETSLESDADLQVLRKHLIRSFIAGPFGARRLQDNLKEVLCHDGI